MLVEDGDPFPREVDVLVAGSGAAGLTAALASAVDGRVTLVCERAASLGGTTALSGGKVWVPGHHRMVEPQLDRRAAGDYLDAVYGQRHASLVTAFLDAAPAMVRFVER
ncbi:MAG: FAD-binding protein [Acidimicrobiales bacterium]